jgi:hypothetical protein
MNPQGRAALISRYAAGYDEVVHRPADAEIIAARRRRTLLADAR